MRPRSTAPALVAVLALFLAFATAAPDALAQSAPVVTSVTIVDDPGPGDDRIYAGCDVIKVDVLFDQQLGMTGVPQLALVIGNETVQARALYVRGTSAGGVVRFEYAVRARDFDNNGISIAANAIDLNGGTIRNRNDVDANINLGSHAIMDDVNHKVDSDTDICQVAITSSPAAGGIYRAGERIVVEVRVNRRVTLDTTDGTPRVALTFGTGTQTQTRYAGFEQASADHRVTVLTFRYTVAAGDSDPDGISIAANAVELNRGEFFNLADHPVTLTLEHAAVPAASGQKVDAPVLAVPRAPDLSGVTVSVSGQTLSFQWTARAADAARAAVTGYRVERSADGNAPWTAITPNLGAPAMPGSTKVVFTEQNVPRGTTRHYRVFALSAAGDSQPSATVSGTVPAAAGSTQTGGGGGSGGGGNGGGNGGGGGGGGGSRDLHGNTPAQATTLTFSPASPRRATANGQISPAGDVDYFTVEIPRAGLLIVETTGRTDTAGTVWQHDEELASARQGGERRNFRLSTPVEAGPVLIAVMGNGNRTGAYTLVVRLVVGFFGNPRPGSAQSGIGVLSGWVCEADTVEVQFETGTTGATRTELAAIGTTRPDTASECGDTDNGFGLLWNWNRLGAGTHTVRALVDGEVWAEHPLTVTTLGITDADGHEMDFPRGLSGTYTVADFPDAGATTTLEWQQALQNFVIVPTERTDDASGETGAQHTPATAQLDNPQPGSSQSGVGVISGWKCDCEDGVIEIEFENLTTGATQTETVGYGTQRPDTDEPCGDQDNGFGLLWNWNRLGEGAHIVRVFADGEEFAWSRVTVTTLGEEFPRGLAGTALLEDFPTEGQAVTVEWQEALQNFTITGRQ